MAPTPPKQRNRKRLLVASVGVATVSFLAVQSGCEGPEEMHVVANLLAPPNFDSAEARDAALDATSQGLPDALPGSGNLVTPPFGGLPPQQDSGTAIATSGNLLPVPLDAALDAAQDAAQDAQLKDANADGASADKD